MFLTMLYEALLGWIMSLAHRGAVALYEWMGRRISHKLSIKDMLDTSHLVHQHAAELRALTQAERVRVFLFHNGRHFSLNQPIWNVSNVMEIDAPGTAPAPEIYRTTLATHWWQVLRPVFNGQHSICPSHEIAGNGSVKPHIPIIAVCVEALEPGPLRYSYEQMNISCALASPLLGPDGSSIVGFVSADFRDSEAGCYWPNKDSQDANACHLKTWIDYVMRISAAQFGDQV